MAEIKEDVDGDLDFISKIAKSRRDVAKSVMEFNFNKKRVRILSEAKEVPRHGKCIVYWMFRDQRVEDNWAMLYAQRLALKNELPLVVVHCLIPSFLEATIRQYRFAMKGMQEVEQELKNKNISFHVLEGFAPDVLPAFITNHEAGGLVCEFFPLRGPRKWLDQLVETLPKDVPIAQVDAHNIVPCWEASNKLEYAARTIRNKINSKLPEFLTFFPAVAHHPHDSRVKAEKIDWKSLDEGLKVDRTVDEADWATPGTRGGLNMLETFITKKLKVYDTARNDPTKDALSNLSPWFHFGQISVQRAALEVGKLKSKYTKSVEAFLEESIVRRELADNFCYYNENYDKLEGAYDWARKTLKDHAKDKREHLYTEEELGKGKSHDPLWNGAQIQLVKEGKMHGFLRMYWAKKILEWTKSPEDALRISIYLNDKFNYDGRDPNGYTGCMWSIAGIHDQGWRERPIFGKIRYMNYEGCKRKFDVVAFQNKYRSI